MVMNVCRIYFTFTSGISLRCIYSDTTVLPGQKASVHFLTSIPVPTQFAPPYAGAGLTHQRALVAFPNPQVVLHVVQDVHSDQLPFTATIATHCGNHEKHLINKKCKTFEPLMKLFKAICSFLKFTPLER